MKSLALALLFAQLSIQLPTAQDAAPELVSRAHRLSPHVADLRAPHARRLMSRQYSTNGTNLTTSGGGYIVPNLSGGKYLLPLTVAGETLNVEIDTGSADTWIIQKGFNCYNTANLRTQAFVGKQPEKACNFGTAVALDPSFKKVPNLLQFTCYGQNNEDTNRCLRGHFYNGSVDLLGVEIEGAYIAFPTNSSFHARGQAGLQSGLIGLGFPYDTSAEAAIGGGKFEVAHYSSIMSTLFYNNTYDPPLPKMFSIALSRDLSQKQAAGKFAVGGIPSLNYPDVNVSSTMPVSTPIVPNPAVNNETLSSYSIAIDGFNIGGQDLGAGTVITIDSGAYAFQLPGNLSQEIDKLWSPPGMVQQGNLIVNCTAKLSSPLGITINGTTFYVQEQDILQPLGQNDACTPIYSAGSEETVLLVGDPFLFNVLAVFDWQDLQMSFYPRMYYKS